MPSLLGGFISCIMAAQATSDTYNEQIGEVFGAMVGNNATGVVARAAEDQAAYQLAAIGVTLGIAILGGLVTGAIISIHSPLEILYDDSLEFEIEVVHEEEKEKKRLQTKRKRRIISIKTT
jgi:ammonium transporter Rh